MVTCSSLAERTTYRTGSIAFCRVDASKAASRSRTRHGTAQETQVTALVPAAVLGSEANRRIGASGHRRALGPIAERLGLVAGSPAAAAVPNVVVRSDARAVATGQSLLLAVLGATARATAARGPARSTRAGCSAAACASAGRTAARASAGRTAARASASAPASPGRTATRTCAGAPAACRRSGSSRSTPSAGPRRAPSSSCAGHAEGARIAGRSCSAGIRTSTARGTALTRRTGRPSIACGVS